MAQVIGYIKSLQNGVFFAKDVHGEVRELKSGDQIFKDELVFGAQNNPQNAQVIIDVTLTDASDIVLSGVDQLYADLSVIGGSFEKEDAVVATDSLENAWKLSTNTATTDTTTPLEATAAGIEAPAAGLTTADGDRPINGTFYDRTGLIGDVRTSLSQDTVNGGASQTIARVDTQDYNEQPTVDNVTGSVNEALNGLNQITGQLVASDPDADDTHTFFAVDGSLLINGEPAPEGVILVLNTDGTYSVTGDFNALAVGENAVITFQYYAVDNGLEIGETHTSLPATVTITVQGTNDQPVVSDININGNGGESIIIDTTLENVGGTSYNIGGHAQSFYAAGESLTEIGIEFSGNQHGSFRFDILDAEGNIIYSSDAIEVNTGNSNEIVKIDLSGVTLNPNAKYTIDFDAISGDPAIITHTQQNSADGVGYLYGEGADNTYSYFDDNWDHGMQFIYGGEKAIYETHDGSESATHTNDGNNVLSGALTVADDDATDTHTFRVVENSLGILDASDAGITSENVSVSIVQVDGGWQYNINGDFSKLAAGEKVTVTFQYVADDGRGFDGTDGNNESSVSAPKTITFTITGTNDQPVINDVVVSQVEATNGTNVFEGTLAGQVSDDDTNDTHQFHGVMGEDGETIAYEISSPRDVTIQSIVVNADGSYSIEGDFNALNLGQTATVTFQYYAVDSSTTQANGESNTSEPKTVTLTITGTNDAPVAFADVNSVTEAGSGNFLRDIDFGDKFAIGNVLSNDTDVDNSNLDLKSVKSDITNNSDSSANLLGNFVIHGAYGELVINKYTGSYIYTLNNSNAAIEALNEGDTLQETFTYVVTDNQAGNPLTDTATLTITINGTNDAPVISGQIIGTATEAGNLDDGSIVAATVSTGTLVASDVDNDSPTWSGNAVGRYGSFSIDAETGVWTYTVNADTGSAADKLAEGQVRYETFTVTVTDNETTNPKTDTQMVVIKVVGTNDSPVISETSVVSGTAIEAGNNDDGSVALAVQATGTMVATDVDNGSSLTWSGNATGTYGSFAINASTGKWTYTVDATTGSPADKLKEGQSVTEQFTVIVTDDKGAIDTQVVTITVQGTNDVPVAVADVNSVTEAGSGNFFGDIDMGSPLALGNLLENDSDIDKDSDIDVSKILSVGTSQSDTTPSWLFGNLDVQGAYGTLVVNKETGTYSYMLNNANGAVNALNEGEILADKFVYTVQDNNGAITTSTLTITINGTNDAPVISGETFGVATEAGNYDNGILKDATVATGTLVGNDVDNDSVTWSIQGSSTKTYGSLSIDADGQWTYSVDATSGSAADKLAEGQVRYETFTIVASDNNPINPKTDVQEVTVMIKGTNDSPVVTNASSALLGTVVEAGSNDDGSPVVGIATISGQLSASDVDNYATQKWSIVGTPDTTYGTISINANTGKWTYTLSNADTDTQSLAEGESKTLNYTARVIDDKGAYVDQTITITVQGTNDAPVLTSSTALSFSVAEDAAEADGDKSYSGNIGIGSLATDVDHGAILHIGQVNGVAVDADGIDQTVTFSYTDKDGNAASFEASLHVNQDGTYTISTSNDLNPLPAGVNATASLNFTITDEYGAQTAPKTVNLTITGDNDAPATETITLSSIAEDSGALLITQADLLANASDVDSVNLNATNLAISSGSGTLVDNGNGTWSYTPASNDDTSVSFTYTISDGDKTVMGNATLDITPVNDAPVTTPVTLAAIAEDSGARLITQADLLANASDPVEHDALVATDLTITSGNGTLVDNGNGTWTYTPASNDDTSVNFSYKITDNGTTNGASDPKTITGSATLDITPVNDAPDAIDDSYSYLGANLIINGSFEDINGVNANNQTVSGVALGSLTGTNLVHMKSITGWDLTDNTMAPMEPHAKGHADVGATDGNHYMDLGATPGNSAIVQTINGLSEGALYQFSVDYLDKAAKQGEGNASGVMQILWNGVVVATVQGNNTQVWETLTLNLTAKDGANTLAFKEIGTIDNAGIAIDNVQLKSLNAALVTDEDTALTIMPATLLGNDTDIDGGALFITSVTQPDAAQGTITTTSDVNGHITSILFTPTKDYNGNATFTYTISDGNGGTDTATVTLRVNPVNDAPIAVDDAFVIDEGTALTSMNVLGNDTDKENDTLSVTNANSHDGTVSINPDGTLNFTPNANFTGVATITYAISDGNGGTDTATVLVTVNAVEHTPTLTVDTGNMGNANDTVLESGLATGSSPSTMTKTAEGTFTIGDPDGLDDITSVTIGGETFSIGTGVGEFPDFASLIGETITTSHGEVAITSYSNGEFGYTYTLTEASNVASDGFNVSVTDGSETASATVTIGITDDKPIAYDNAVSLVEGTASSGGGITNILLVLDFSGSMDGANLTAMKASVIELVNAYQDAGGFNLKIVPFNGDLDYTTESGLNTVFTDVTSVTNWLNTVTSWDLGWSTNYEAAVEAAMSTWTSTNISGADAANSIAYFISDGQPNEGNMSSIQTTWENYVDANFTKAIAIGIGNGATAADADLQAVAYTPGGSDEVYLVTNLSELTDTLVGTVEVPTTSTGSVVTETGVLNLVDVSGADGWANPKLVSVTYDGTTHTFDSTHTSFTIPTNAGTVTIDNQGNYTFTSLTNVSHDVSANLTYTVVDSDGSTAQAVLKVTTLDSVPTAVADTATATETYLHATGGTVNNTVYTTVPESWSASASQKSINGTWNINPSYYDDDSGNTTSFNITANATHQASVSVYVDLSNYKSGDSVTVSLYTADGTLVSGQSYTVSTDKTITFSGISASGTYQVHVEGSDNTYWEGDLKVKLNDLKVTSYTYTPAQTTSTIVATQEIEWVAAVAAVGNVLNNDVKGTDGNLSVTVVNGHEITAAGVDITGNNGILHIDTTGAYTYTPTNADMTSAALSTPDVFAYTIKDADGSTSSSTLTITVADHDYTKDATLVGGTDGDNTLNGTNGNDVIYGSAGDDHLYGGAGNDTLYGGAGNDYLDGGTGRDILHGDAGNDTLVYDAQDVFIDGGAGSDTLLFTSNTTIDFSSLDSTTNPVKNVEVLDLTQANVTITNLSLNDVIDMTDSNNTLTILGDSGDKVNVPAISGDYTVAKTVESGFDVYTYSHTGDPTVVVKIDQDIQHS